MLSTISNFKRQLSRPKDLKFGTEITRLLLEGIDKLSDAVVATLGPKGRNVMIEQSYGAPKVTKDGVSVAKSIEFDNKWHNMGAQLVISVAQKTNDIAGDGTTTATLLTRELYREAIKALSAGMDQNELRKGMTTAVNTIIKELFMCTFYISLKRFNMIRMHYILTQRFNSHGPGEGTRCIKVCYLCLSMVVTLPQKVSS